MICCWIDFVPKCVPASYDRDGLFGFTRNKIYKRYLLLFNGKVQFQNPSRATFRSSDDISREASKSSKKRSHSAFCPSGADFFIRAGKLQISFLLSLFTHVPALPSLVLKALEF